MGVLVFVTMTATYLSGESKTGDELVTGNSQSS